MEIGDSVNPGEHRETLISLRKSVKLPKGVKDVEDKVDANLPEAEVEDGFEITGGMGRFQWIAIVCFMVNANFGSFFILNIPFFIKEPALLCKTPGGTSEVACLVKDVCANKYAEWRIDWDSPETYDNWMVDPQLDLMCASKFELALFGSLYFVGWSVGFIWLRTADVYGRKKVFMPSLIIYATIYALLLVIHNKYFFYFGTLSMGMLQPTQSTLSYIYVMELVPSRHRGTAAAIINFFEGLTFSITALFFYFVSTNWLYLNIAAYSLMIPVFFIKPFFPESPMYLHSKGRFAESRASFNRIANFNGVYPMRNRFVGEELEDKNRNDSIQNEQDAAGESALNKFESAKIGHSVSKGTLRELCRDRPLVIKILFAMMCWIGITYNFYLMKFNIARQPGSTLANTLILGASESIAMPLSAVIIHKAGALFSIYLLESIAIIFGFTFILIDIGVIPENAWLILVFILLCHFCTSVSLNSVYVATVDIFPAIYMSTIFGLCNIVARLSITPAPAVALQERPLPMITYTIVAMIVTIGAVSIKLIIKGEKDKEHFEKKTEEDNVEQQVQSQWIKNTNET